MPHVRWTRWNQYSHSLKIKKRTTPYEARIQHVNISSKRIYLHSERFVEDEPNNNKKDYVNYEYNYTAWFTEPSLECKFDGSGGYRHWHTKHWTVTVALRNAVIIVEIRSLIRFFLPQDSFRKNSPSLDFRFIRKYFCVGWKWSIV